MTGGGKTTDLYNKQAEEAARRHGSSRDRPPKVYRHASGDPWKSKKSLKPRNVRRPDSSEESAKLPPPDHCTFY